MTGPLKLILRRETLRVITRDAPRHRIGAPAITTTSNTGTTTLDDDLYVGASKLAGREP